MTGIRSWMTACGDMPAFVAVPAGTAQAPAVIVVHERYGFVRHTRDLAERFARDGFVAVAPDLYFRHPDQEALHRGDAACDVSDPDAAAAFATVINALTAIPQADHGRIAIMGVCQTGRLPLVVAASRPIAAALVWYGAAQPREWGANAKYPRPLDDIIAAVTCPVLGVFGETDHLISLTDIRRFRDCLERHHKSYSIHVYRDCPHGWLNDTMPGRYRPVQAEAAWADQRAFLAHVLAPGYDASTRTQRYAADIGADYDFSRHVRYE
jgi:carboxymethylenebutenolidase